MTSVLTILAALNLLTAPGDSIPRLAIRKELEIRPDGAGYTFALVTDALPTKDGGIAILEPRDGRVSVFSATGAFIRSIGARGEGPGEFQSASWMTIQGDTVNISDVGTNRLTRLALSGRVVESVRLPRTGDGVLLPGRRLLVIPVHTVSAFERPASALRLLVVNPSGQVEDTLFSVADSGRTLRYVRGGGMMVGVQPFDDQPLFAVQRRGAGVVLVEREVSPSSSPHARITRFSEGGRRVFRTTLPYTPIAIPPTLVDSQIARLVRSGPPVGTGSLPERIRRALFVPAHLPTITGVVAGLDGTAWIRREEKGDSLVTWTFLNPRGVVAGEIQLPTAAHVTAATADQLWVVVPDADDLPHVIRYRVAVR